MLQAGVGPARAKGAVYVAIGRRQAYRETGLIN